MAKSNSGKLVSRIGASGGGKAYRKVRPMNYYGAISLIVVLGLLSIVYSRYEYQNPASDVAPTIGTTWFASFNAEACGANLPDLIADTKSGSAGFAIGANNVVTVSPKVADEAGNNATVARFISEHPGLSFTNSSYTLPTPVGIADPQKTYHNGDKCPAGSKYAGKVGHVGIAYWTSIGQKDPKITTDPSSIKFSDLMRFTLFFEPDNVKPLQSSVTNLAAMVKAQQALGGTGTTTTSMPSVVTSTTVVNVTTTTQPAVSTTSTSLPSTSTTISGQTTTTAP